MATVSDRVVPKAELERIGRFEILERARSSAFSILYRGRDPFVGRAVEVEVCVASDERVRRLFLLAAEQASLLHHPNIATVHEFGSGDSKPYLVREAFSESTLAALLEQQEPIEDVLKLYYLGQLARGLEYAHGKGVLHRQLQASSILVRPDGRVKISDFGTARLASAAAHIGSGPRHKPVASWLMPELLLGLDLDERSDVYGFGAVAYELLTGSPPFASETIGDLAGRILESDPDPVAERWPECPEEISSLISKCLRRDPSRRFGRFSALIEELSATIPVPENEEVEQELETLVTTDLQTVYIAEQGESESPAQPASEAIGDRAHSLLQASRRNFRHWVAAWVRGITLVVAGARTRLLHASSNLRWRLGPRWVAAIGAVLIALVAGFWREPESDAPRDRPVVGSRPVEIGVGPAGTMVIDARPWARVAFLVDGQGDSVPLPEEAYTPLSLELSPGQYLATLEPLDGPAQQCSVEVVSGSVRPCRPALNAEIGTDVYFRETGWWQ